MSSTAPVAEQVRPQPVAATPDLPKPAKTQPRWRARQVALGVAVIILGALTGLYLAGREGDTTPVIAIATNLERGSLITEADVTEATIVSGDFAPLPADRIGDVIGLRAATDLVAGTFLTEASLASDMVPAEGQRLVGLPLTAAQMPGEPLQAGDIVLVVDTPTAGGDPPEGTPDAIEAVVSRTHSGEDPDRTIVDVLVGGDDALNLAARAASGRIAVVLDSRDR